MDKNKILIFNDGSNIKKRKINYTKESINHPSKMHIELCIWIINTFTKEYSTILDPMAGIFTTGIEGTLLKRNVIGLELEQEYVKQGNKSIKILKSKLKVTSKNNNIHSYITQGDAKDISMIFKDKKFDTIIFSPPYFNRTTGFNIKNKEKWMKFRMNKWYKGKLSKEALKRQTYNWTKKQYSDDKNIAKNNKISTYFDNMFEIYTECFKILNTSGLMILVTKNPVINKKQFHIDKKTIDICEEIGFKLFDRYYRKLKNKGIWQRTYEKKWKEKYPSKECPIA
ncbi:MAG: DNA methyltransferase, partial [Atribacterota bacterium]